jgi:hypothetical protein
MAKLSDGRELKPDFTRITVKEYRLLIAATEVEQEDELIGKVYGLSGDELRGLTYQDYRLISKEFIAAARDPVGFDPN